MNDEFTSKHFVDPKTGKAHRIYTYKRKQCNRIVLTSRLCTQLAGYALIEKDLRSVLTWLDEIGRRHTDGPTRTGENYFSSSDRENYNLIKGLFVAALTFYGKCFSKCDGRPVKLERSNINSRFHELHDQCIVYRHNFAAHSGSEKLEHVDVVLVFPSRYKKKVTFKIYRELDQPDVFWPGPDRISLAQLVQHAREFAAAKIEWLTLKIQNEEVIPNAKSYWREK